MPRKVSSRKSAPARNSSAHADVVLDLSGQILLPGFVNTHHHLDQTLTRNLPAAQNNNLFPWLQVHYRIWAARTPAATRCSTLIGLAELAMTGCTTVFDHSYVFQNGCRVDDQIAAAKEIGVRFHACRGSMSLGESRGGLPPDDCVEQEDAIMRDCRRAIVTYHDSSHGAMTRMTLGLCSPFSVTSALLRDTAQLARAYKVRMHTHLCEMFDEENFILSRFQQRPVDWIERFGWLGNDVWFAHAVHVDDEEIARLAKAGVGVAHCPSSNMRLASGIAPVKKFLDAGVKVGLDAVVVFAAVPRAARSADNRSGPAPTGPRSAASPGISANPGAPGGKAAAASSTSTSPPAASGAPTFTGNKLYAISANPGATNLLPWKGLLGRLIGFEPNSSVRIGGLWIGNADHLLTGGVKPRSWSFNSLLILDLNLDIEKLIDLTGSSVDASMLQFNGENTNGKAGLVLGYDGLTGPKPFVRTQLYQLWWRQSWFADKLVIRVGKTVPTIDFNNVSRPIAVSDESLTIPSVTGLIYTPIFKNPTLIGAAPRYYNSAYGITANVAPTPNSYFTCAIYDGALATGVESGLDATPVFNGHYFTIGEAGHAWLLGREAMPGKVAVGGWAQTGTLEGPGVKQNGSQGLYTFAASESGCGIPASTIVASQGFSSSVSMTRIP
jgi:amidohydrolase family protein/carbohydrate-selective porin (OprB family)